MERFLRKLRLERADPVVLLVLLLAGLKFTFGMTRVLDVFLYDESDYLYSGATLAQHGFPAPEYAPLYALWYHALSWFQPDRVHLYYLNMVLTTVLPPLFLYGWLRVNRVPVVVSAAVAAYFLTTAVNAGTMPRPMHFALLIVLLALIAASFARRAEFAVAVVAIGALLASYVRPEYFLALLLLLAFDAGLSLAQWRRGRSPAAFLPPGVVVLLAAVLLCTLGPPMFGHGGDKRQYYAFTQHFANHWAQWNHVSSENGYDPLTNYQEIAARYFGDATTVSAAWRNNPGMFARHVFTNFSQVFVHSKDLLLYHENVLVPLGQSFLRFEGRLMQLFLLGVLYVKRRAIWPGLRTSLPRHRLQVACVGLLCVPAAISAVAIAPRDHYLLLPGVLLVALAVTLLFGSAEELPALRPSALFLLAFVVLAAMPTLSHRPPVDTPVARTIRSLQSLGLTGRVNELDSEGGYSVYQTPNYRHLAEYGNRGSFDQYMAKEGINMVVCTERLRKDSHLINDPEWRDFLDHYESAGFVARSVPGTGTTLLIKKDLLVTLPGP